MTDTELPDIRTHKLCRSCGQWLTPEYGAMYAPARGSLYTPGALVRDIVSDASGDTSHYYFRCHDCEHKRKRRKLWFWFALVLLLGAAQLFRYLTDS
jgi:hypothetical protein